MDRFEGACGGGAINRTSPRTLFADLVAGALGVAGAQPTEMATAYLIELLTDRVRIAEDEGERTLAEALLRARLERGSVRTGLLRAIGDRALFVSGFFGDSLMRSLTDLDYYRSIGRSAYGDLSSWLALQPVGPAWGNLFGELADRFGDFVDVLSEVGDRTRSARPTNLLRLYERYLRTGSRRDRDRLLRLGLALPSQPGLRSWQ